MIKVLIYIPLWRRSKLFETVAASLRHQTSRLDNYDVQVLCCISPEDPERNKHELICNRNRFNFIHCSNEFMGAKMNAGVEASLSFDYDYFMNFGSDDLIHRKLFDVYEEFCLRGELMFGIKSLYFYDTQEHKALFYSYRKPTCIGAGRMIHRNVIESIIKSGKNIYTPTRQMALDYNSKVNIEALTGIRETIVGVSDFPYIVDMKSDTNINSFKTVMTHGMYMRMVSANILLHYPGVTI